MGFHVCEFCPKSVFLKKAADTNHRFDSHSSGDVNLTFKNGHSYTMPDMILHYIADHQWEPPLGFVLDVMTQELECCGRAQTRGLSHVAIYSGKQVGYLTLGDGLTPGEVPIGFIEKLEELMEQAKKAGMRAQTKGLVLPK